MGSQLPYGPKELAAAPLQGGAFIVLLKNEKQRKYPEPPPFLKSLIEGELSLDEIRMWVKDFYPYWDEGLVYATGAIYVKTNDEPLRTHMLRRMVDVEGKDVVNDLVGWTTPAYEELWLRFGEGLGLDRAEVTDFQQFTRTYMSMRTMMTYSRFWDWTWLDGIATWYAADLQWKEHYPKVMAALKDIYNVSEMALEFFRVLLEDVDSHVTWEEEGLAYWACTTERQLTAARAFRERLDIEDQLLVAVETARTAERLPFQTPAI
jgi:pyrroloquinoline quinone (PQQ) biosynthesis protein C